MEVFCVKRLARRHLKVVGVVGVAAVDFLVAYKFELLYNVCLSD